MFKEPFTPKYPSASLLFSSLLESDSFFLFISVFLSIYSTSSFHFGLGKIDIHLMSPVASGISKLDIPGGISRGIALEEGGSRQHVIGGWLQVPRRDSQLPMKLGRKRWRSRSWCAAWTRRSQPFNPGFAGCVSIFITDNPELNIRWTGNKNSAALCLIK